MADEYCYLPSHEFVREFLEWKAEILSLETTEDDEII